jgi:hypothetical protein
MEAPEAQTPATQTPATQTPATRTPPSTGRIYDDFIDPFTDR